MADADTIKMARDKDIIYAPAKQKAAFTREGWTVVEDKKAEETPAEDKPVDAKATGSKKEEAK